MLGECRDVLQPMSPTNGCGGMIQVVAILFAVRIICLPIRKYKVRNYNRFNLAQTGSLKGIRVGLAVISQQVTN
jgi:hypothetical protein